MTKAVYEIASAAGLDAALRDLRGYWKLWSACLLHKACLPTLSGLIVTRSDPQLDKDIDVFLHGIEAAEALIRHDIKNEGPPYPRGGFVVPERLLPEIIDFFFRLSRIVAIYEPADPVLNSYNLNILFQTAADVWIEVVGPGFDASDLQRGDLSPHEVFSAALSTDGKVSELRRINGVDKATYEESRKLRIRKLKQKFQEWPTPELARKLYSSLKLPLEMDEYLKNLRSPLAKAKTYAPISQAVVINTVGAIVNSNVIGIFQRETGADFPLNFSTSFVENGRQVYWDIVSPKLKFRGLKL